MNGKYFLLSLCWLSLNVVQQVQFSCQLPFWCELYCVLYNYNIKIIAIVCGNFWNHLASRCRQYSRCSRSANLNRSSSSIQIKHWINTNFNIVLSLGVIKLALGWKWRAWHSTCSFFQDIVNIFLTQIWKGMSRKWNCYVERGHVYYSLF